MPLATSPETDALAYALASLRGLTADEVVAAALRAELERDRRPPVPRDAAQKEPVVEEIMARILSLGAWEGPGSEELERDLYDAEGLPR